jgi:hypothetical protein
MSSINVYLRVDPADLAAFSKALSRREGELITSKTELIRLAFKRYAAYIISQERVTVTEAEVKAFLNMSKRKGVVSIQEGDLKGVDLDILPDLENLDD